MRILQTVLALLCCGAAVVLYMRRQAPSWQEFDAIPRGAPRTELAPLPRDASGALILSDPADDLAGFESSGEAFSIAVGERELYLLDLYGQQPREQLLSELELLNSRFEREQAAALTAGEDPGLHELVDTIAWLEARLGP